MVIIYDKFTGQIIKSYLGRDYLPKIKSIVDDNLAEKFGVLKINYKPVTAIVEEKTTTFIEDNSLGKVVPIIKNVEKIVGYVPDSPFSEIIADFNSGIKDINLYTVRVDESGNLQGFIKKDIDKDSKIVLNTLNSIKNEILSLKEVILKKDG